MTNHVGRLYSLALALVVFFLAWAVVSAHPWRTSSKDPRLQQLAIRQAQLKHEAKLVQQILTLRRARREAAAQAGAAQVAPPPPPAVRVVNLPPLTITRTS